MGFLVLGRGKFLQGFHDIWAWRPSWSYDQDHLNKLSFPHPKQSLYMKFEFNWSSGIRGEDVDRIDGRWMPDASLSD